MYMYIYKYIYICIYIYAPCLACRAVFGSLVPATCNGKLCAQVHELLQSHCRDNREGTLFS